MAKSTKTRILAIANHKGGVSKTTTALVLSSIYSRRGERVLLVDLDAQANASLSMIEGRPEVTLYDAMVNNEKLPIVHVKNHDNGGLLDVVPSGLQLSWVDLSLSATIAREQILRGLLAEISDNYDLIVLDCPPSLGLMAQNAFVAATDILIPLNADSFSMEGLSMIISFFSMIQKRLNPKLNLLGMVITQLEKNTLSRSISSVLKSAYPNLLLSTSIRKNIAVGKAQSMKMELAEFDDKCAAFTDYVSLASELDSRMNK